MPRDKRRELEWVAKNRSRKSGVCRVGSAVEAVVGTLERQGLEPAIAVARALAPIVDDEFRRHCRVGKRANGPLTIQVDVPPLVHVMRQKWSTAIREELNAVDRRMGGATIVFEQGYSGVEIPPA